MLVGYAAALSADTERKKSTAFADPTFFVYNYRDRCFQDSCPTGGEASPLSASNKVSSLTLSIETVERRRMLPLMEGSLPLNVVPQQLEVLSEVRSFPLVSRFFYLVFRLSTWN